MRPTKRTSIRPRGARPPIIAYLVSMGMAMTMATVLALALPGQAQETDANESVGGESEGLIAPDRPSALAQFTTAVENREPIDQVTFVSSDVRKIFFFSDLRGLAGRQVTHRWMHDGETKAEVVFEVGGPRWRVWSSKELLEDWLGDWTVEIATDDGEVIAAETFTYSAPDA